MVRVTVPEPEALFAATCAARLAGVLHDAEVPSEVPIVPVEEPKVYASVCVRFAAALVIVKPSEFPIVTAEEFAATVETGIVPVKLMLDVPTEVFPLKVSHVIVPVPLFAFVSCEERDAGGVKETEVEEVFVAIVPEAEPKE